MAWSVDARIPVSILPDAASVAEALAQGKPAALLGATEAGLPANTAAATASFPAGAAPHMPACTCCLGRSPAATVLATLFQSRARGTVAWFDRVLVMPEAADDIRIALSEDSVASAWFKLA